MGPDQTQHMFIYPALALRYPPCHFAWWSLRAIRRGSRFRNLWQRLFLIHKSQKDQFKIHEQSVLLQLVVSVTVGQWRHRGKFCLHSFYRETQAFRRGHLKARTEGRTEVCRVSLITLPQKSLELTINIAWTLKTKVVLLSDWGYRTELNFIWKLKNKMYFH